MTAGKKAFINPTKCKHCKECIPQKKCGANAIDREDDDIYVSPLCSGCRICLDLCPHQAIKLA